MNADLNPQAKEMADESMVRNLAAQAEAIWPQEKPLFDRYRLPMAQFEGMIATLDDPSGYGVWHVPVVAARVP